MKVTIELPIPPTLNSMFPDGAKKRGLSQRYRDWRDEAGWHLATQRIQPYCVPVLIDMTIIGGRGFPTSSDISNRWKAIEDLLVTHGILKDDNVLHVVGHCDRYEAARTKSDKARCILTIQESEER